MKVSILAGFLIFSSSFFAVSVMAEASLDCIDSKKLMQQSVLIQKQGHGKGSGILYNPEIVLTNQHVIKDIEKVWVYIPRIQKSISASVLHSASPPDIAVLKLSEKVPETDSLKVADNIEKEQKLTLVSMPFGKPHLLDAVEGVYKTPIKLKGSLKGKPENMNITLTDWAFAGDSGGAYFTCEGLLAGIHFGNQGHKNKPSNAFAVNGYGILTALKKAGIR
jgi:S1-C subfamily serine protease